MGRCHGMKSPRERLLPSLLLLKGPRAGLPGRSPCRYGRAVTLGGPLCPFVNHSFFLLLQTTLRAGPHPGARASRPHRTWHSLGYLLHPGRPATASGLRFGRAYAAPVGRVAGCGIAGKQSGTQRECKRAGRPRSRGGLLPSLLLLEGACAGLPGSSPPLPQNRYASWPFVVLRVPWWITLSSFVSSQSQTTRPRTPHTIPTENFAPVRAFDRKGRSDAHSNHSPRRLR